MAQTDKKEEKVMGAILSLGSKLALYFVLMTVMNLMFTSYVDMQSAEIKKWKTEYEIFTSRIQIENQKEIMGFK